MPMHITGQAPKVGQVLTITGAAGKEHYRVTRVYPGGGFDWVRLPNRAARRKGRASVVEGFGNG